MSKKKLRRQFFVDAYVQTGIIQRLTIYWVASLLFVTLPIAFFNTFQDPSIFFFTHVANVFTDHWPVFVMMLVLLPFALNDALKFSNRFTGPVYRLRSELEKFNESGKLNSIKFREDDFWHDLADGVNKISQRLDELEQELQTANLHEEEEEYAATI